MTNDLIEQHPPGAVALIEGDRSTTYGELRELVAQTAAGLRTAGVGPGDQVAVVGDNDTSFVTALLGALTAGAAVCPLTSQTPDDVLSARLGDLAPRAVLASPASVGAAVLVRDAGHVDAGRVGVPAGLPSDDLPTLSQAHTSAPTPVEPTDPAMILHTSGIVGASRPALLTHGNLTAAQDRLIAHGAGLDAAAVAFGALPFAHVLGLNAVLLSHLRVGASVVLQSRWDATAALELIERHQVTNFVGVPPMWAAMAGAAGSADQMRSVGFARTGASTLHPDVAAAVFDTFGIELVEGYGLTETAGTVTLEPNARRHPGSVGRALDGVELRLVDDGEEVELGDRGEIWVRTASPFQGYLADPVATAEVVVADGWCRTGDIGIQDDDGTLYLVGRSKDLINVSGFNVYPHDIEMILEEHPSIRESMVVGEPHNVNGERIVAYVTVRDGAVLQVDDVLEHCRARLSRYKIPSSIHLVDRLPMTAIGKRVRAELR